MRKRNRLCITVIMMLILCVTAKASGLFPETDELFGISMPSVGLSVGRAPDAQDDTQEGSQETYQNFSGDEYLVFGQYLAGIGAKVKEYKVEGSVMTATISARGNDIVFSYDWAEKTATAVYPSGTRAEMTKEEYEPGESILPPVGGIMPSAEFAISRKPDKQEETDEGLVLSWDQFSDEDYVAFSAYLAETGAKLKSSGIEDGVLNTEIELNGSSFRFIYDWNVQTARAIYSEGTTPEQNRWNAPVGEGSILPDIKSIGKELPRISVALKREPSATETLQDGSIQETYSDFSEDDYNVFSQYLQKTGCQLDDYKTDESGALVIHLSNGSGKFTFSYDSVRHTGIAVYPGRTRVEKGWMLTPTPTPEATPKPADTVVVTARYSENDCWNIAYNYFLNLRWKNPQSLKIYSHSAIFSNGEYTFTIDHSAENSFGGTTRAYYWITVNASTGTITLAFGSN